MKRMAPATKPQYASVTNLQKTTPYIQTNVLSDTVVFHSLVRSFPGRDVMQTSTNYVTATIQDKRRSCSHSLAAYLLEQILTSHHRSIQATMKADISQDSMDSEQIRPVTIWKREIHDNDRCMLEILWGNETPLLRKRWIRSRPLGLGY